MTSIEEARPIEPVIQIDTEPPDTDKTLSVECMIEKIVSFYTTIVNIPGKYIHLSIEKVGSGWGADVTVYEYSDPDSPSEDTDSIILVGQNEATIFAAVKKIYDLIQEAKNGWRIFGNSYFTKRN